MIVSNLIGGLGNQMFQFAAGFAASKRLSDYLKLDVSSYDSYKLHQGFELYRVFNCKADIATNSDINEILGYQSLPIIRTVVESRKFNLLRKKNFIIEPSFNYWNNFVYLHKNSYLVGYWQSERYFKCYEDLIRNEFSFKLPFSKLNAELSEQISMVNSVALHVRRGDYASNPKTAAMHGLCSVDYYNMAIQYIANQVDKPYFYIFSDDVGWATDNIKLNYPSQYVQHNTGSESYNDMRLMSLCKHNIIANSSFSWWSAWLNVNPTKIVIAPNKWFAKDVNTTDLIPSSWVKI